MLTQPQSPTLDPYRDWLGLPEAKHPRHAYQLLKLPSLESNQAKIRVAYQRQAERLAAFRETAEPEVWEQIERELAAAFDTLCDDQRKAVLDAALRRASGASVPQPPAEAEASGKQVRCRSCQTPNPASRRFCSGCGAGLWEHCPRCQAECPADERFCGACGVDIAAELKTLDDQHRARFREAKEHLDQHRYEDALALFRQLAALEDLRFQKWIDRSLAAIDKVEQQRQSHRLRAEQAYAKAQKMLAARAYENAVAALEDVPPPFRTPAIEQTLRQAVALRNELLSLAGDIREALRENQTGGVLLKLERLIELRPDHDKAVEMGGRFRDQYLQEAKQALQQGDFSQARETLEQITPTFRNDKVAALYERAAELESLVADLQSGALADANLQSLADRLVQLAPDYAAGKRLQEQIREKSNTKPADERLGAPDWRPQPAHAYLGAPVDWLAGLRSIPTGSDQVRETLADHPGDFLVAQGLALQALGRAQLPLLLAGKQAGFSLRGIASVFDRKPTVAWGLDLGDTGLKALKLTADPKTGALTIAAAEFILHELSLAAPEAEFRKLELCEATLKDFLTRADLKGAKVAVSLPGERVLGRFIQLPPLPAKKVESTLLYEVKNQIPVPLDDLRWGQAASDPRPAKEADQAPRKFAVAAIREAHAAEREQLLERVGIKGALLQCDAVALHNALVHEFYPPPPKPAKGAKPADKPPATDPPAADDAIALIDVGALATTVVVSSRHSVWFRNVGHSGNAITAQLVKQLQLTFEQAEKLKRTPAKAPRFYRYCETVNPLLAQLAGEIERSLASYRKLFPEHSIRRVYGVGGGMRTHGLLRWLREGK